MAFYYETPYSRALDAREFTSPFADSFSASAAQAFHEGPVMSLVRGLERAFARDPDNVFAELPPTQLETENPGEGDYARAIYAGVYSPRRLLTKTEVEDRIKAAGLAGHLKAEDNLRGPEVDLLIREKKRELQRKSEISRADNGLFVQTGLVGAGFVGSLLDPLNVAASFIPFVGPSRAALMLGEAGAGAMARAGARARIGMLEGGLGTAIFEPAVAMSLHDYQQEYGAAEIFMNIAFGTALGGGLHVGAGHMLDRIARRGEFFRETGRYYDQAYASFVHEYRGLAAEYGFNLDLRGFEARLTGKLGDGFFGPKTKKLFEEYERETNAIARELDLPPPGRTPDDFMRWVEYKEGLRAPTVPVEKHAEPKPEKPLVPDYDVPIKDTPPLKSYLDVGEKAPDAKPVVTIQNVSRLTEFANTIPAEAREVGIWYAANRFMSGQVAGLRPFYQMFGVQKRLTEARDLSSPRAQEIVAGFKGGDVRMTPQLLDGRFAYKLDFGDTGPKAYLHPEGFKGGDRIEWTRFGVNQLGEGQTAKIVSVKGDKAIIEGWGQPVPLSEIRMIEAGPAARKHRLEIEWGDLGVEIKGTTAELPGVARVRAGDKLLQVLRADQKFDPQPVTRQFEHADRPEADIMYSQIDPREHALALREADSILAERSKSYDEPIPPPKGSESPTKLKDEDKPTKTQAPGKKGDETPTKLGADEEPTIRTPVEDKQIADMDVIAKQKAEQHGRLKEYDDLMSSMDAEIAKSNEKAYFMEHYVRCILGDV